MKQEDIDRIKSSLLNVNEEYFPLLNGFIEFLKTNPRLEKPKGRPRDLLGMFEGDLVYMSPDFDEPLELVEEKRLKELEAIEEAYKLKEKTA